MLPQPPADEPTPEEIPPFFRIGPLTLVLGSFCIYGTLVLLAEALQWRDLKDGIKSGMLLAILATILIAPLQFLIAFACMSRKRRGNWRTLLVIIPALLVSLLSIYQISTLYPHERRARNQLASFLQGPVPPSVRNLDLDYRGDAFGGTRWLISFDLSPADWDSISKYPPFESSPLHAASGRAWGHEGGAFFAIEFDSAARRCRYTITSD